jgi:predicted Zn-ribbon and HTH transcriptional regulator
MKHCPECGDEFEDWVKECPDCYVDLLDGPKPAVEKPQPHLSRDELVTIASYSHAEEAYVVWTRLQSEGILSFVADDYMVTMNWLYSNAVGGVKVRVRESDVEKAVRVLGIEEKDIQPVASDLKTCPQCNSTDIRYQTFSIRPMYITWILTFMIGGMSGFILPFLKLKWVCNTCGHQWKDHR